MFVGVLFSLQSQVHIFLPVIRLTGTKRNEPF